MKGRVVALDTVAGRPAAALIVDGRLEDIFLDGGDGPPVPGTIFRGHPERPVKGQGGVFLRLPEGTAFLRRTRGVTPGRALLVQVSGYAEPGKAVPVAARLLFKSRYAIVTPDTPGINVARAVTDISLRDRLLEMAHAEMGEAAYGMILRSAAATGEAEAVAADIAAMRDLARSVLDQTSGPPECILHGPGARHLALREWSDPAPDEVADRTGAFLDHGVLDALDALRSPEVELAGLGSMTVEPTRALTAVDVNTGGDTSPSAGLKANIAAMRALPRQLRLRGLGGQIAIDPAPVPKTERRRIDQTLKAALQTDTVETTLVGWTPLGHIELQRKRDRRPLAEMLAR